MDDQPSDRQAIINLTIAYCRIVDRGTFEDLRDLFTPDATAELSGSGQNGIDEICDRLATALAAFVSWQHVVDQHVVTIDGDRAIARCSVRAVHVRSADKMPREYTVVGTYEDRLVRSADGWRFTHRRLVKLHA